MPTFVAFLRAVNVGKRKYPMAELRAALTEAGFDEVETHIQTGNVLFTTSMRSRSKIVAALEAAMLADRGFEVPVVLLTPAELSELEREASKLAADGEHQAHYVTLLLDEPGDDARARLEELSSAGEQVRVGGRAVHLLLDKPYHEVTMSNAALERQLGVATTRNLTVIRKLAEKWGT